MRPTLRAFISTRSISWMSVLRRYPVSSNSAWWPFRRASRLACSRRIAATVAASGAAGDCRSEARMEDVREAADCRLGPAECCRSAFAKERYAAGIAITPPLALPEEYVPLSGRRFLARGQHERRTRLPPLSKMSPCWPHWLMAPQHAPKRTTGSFRLFSRPPASAPQGTERRAGPSFPCPKGDRWESDPSPLARAFPFLRLFRSARPSTLGGLHPWTWLSAFFHFSFVGVFTSSRK